MGLMRKAYDAAKSADDGARAEAFARAVADGVASSCIGIANDRMSENVAYSGRSEYVRYAYVPTSSKVCGFCCMVASRDFAYRNPKRPSLHEGCRCLIVPGLKDKTVLGGYDPDVYRKGYDLLVKRGEHGGIVRDADGIPVFKADLTFDFVERKVVGRERDRKRIYDAIDRVSGGYIPASIASKAEAIDFAKRTDSRTLCLKGDYWISASSRIKLDESSLHFRMHGQADCFLYGHRVTAAEFADVVLSRNDFSGQSIVLVSCSVGDERTCVPFAQQLANLLRVDVWGPTRTIWASDTLMYNISDRAFDDDKSGFFKRFRSVL